MKLKFACPSCKDRWWIDVPGDTVPTCFFAYCPVCILKRPVVNVQPAFAEYYDYVVEGLDPRLAEGAD